MSEEKRKKYRVRRGYVVWLGTPPRPYRAGQIVMLSNEEYEAQKWKVEPVREEKKKAGKQVKAPKTTAIQEGEAENR